MSITRSTDAVGSPGYVSIPEWIGTDTSMSRAMRER